MDSEILRPVVKAWKVPAAFGAAYFGCLTAEMSKNLFVAAKEFKDEGDFTGKILFGSMGTVCGGMTLGSAYLSYVLGASYYYHDLVGE